MQTKQPIDLDDERLDQYIERSNGSCRETVIDLYNKGLPLAEIAALIGKTKDVVNNALRKNGVRNRHPGMTDEVKQYIINSNAAGLNDAEIAEQLKMSYRRISFYRHDLLGLPKIGHKRNRCMVGYKKRIKLYGTITGLKTKANQWTAFMDGAPIGLMIKDWNLIKEVARLGRAAYVDLERAFGVKQSGLNKRIYKLKQLGFIRCVQKPTQTKPALFSITNLVKINDNQEEESI